MMRAKRVAVVVVGAGQAGLAMSRHLALAGLDHVVLERGEVASSWRTERWDSLRLLTPNWMCRLPGHQYEGPDPDGYQTAAETAAWLEDYACRTGAPIRTGVTVRQVRRTAAGFAVGTDDGCYLAAAVVVAAGASSDARVPAVAAELPHRINQVTALRYRNPTELDTTGDVLVVGASASGIQIADELRRSGRSVTLAVGEHVRLPRTYRGRDIYSWLVAVGQLDERYDEVEDIERARRHASVQLVGHPTRMPLDLNALSAGGVDLVGRLMRVSGRVAQFSGALASLTANADLKQARLLQRIDNFVAEHELSDKVPGPDRPAPTRLGAVPTEVDLERFTTVIWATGYRPSYPWLDPAAFDRRGRVAHDGGVSPVPGLYVLGLPFLRRRRSNLIAGVGDDAAELLPHLLGHVRRAGPPRVERRSCRSVIEGAGKQRVPDPMDHRIDGA
jgi:putative flavoprotein involved in K+ transport